MFHNLSFSPFAWKLKVFTSLIPIIYTFSAWISIWLRQKEQRWNRSLKTDMTPQYLAYMSIDKAESICHNVKKLYMSTNSNSKKEKHRAYEFYCRNCSCSNNYSNKNRKNIYDDEWRNRGYKACELVNTLINQYCITAYGSPFWKCGIYGSI